ncbi:MAG: ABC transporter permease subunit [Verrucomicrobiaceae bacterium]|nr:MAG: ABC transporter permease subunit [Verrucomicrobiaceae bacterium]
MSTAAAPTSAAFQLPHVQPGRSLWQDAWARLRRNRLAILCGGLLVAIVLFCFLGPWLTGWNPTETNLALKATPPGTVEIRPDGSGGKHWMGTDPLGRDILTRIMRGGQVSLMVGLVATGVALLIGVGYGATAGYLGGRWDAGMMRFVDVLYALPFMIFVILLTTMFGKSMLLIFLAIGAVEWLTMARIVRAQVQVLVRQEFVEAARSLGLSTPAILIRHIIPNVLGPVIVYSTLTVPAVMLLEAALSFLGLGVQPPDSSWGTLINDGAENLETSPWLLLYPAAFFSATLFCLNFVGDGLRDALDVRASKD